MRLIQLMAPDFQINNNKMILGRRILAHAEQVGEVSDDQHIVAGKTTRQSTLALTRNCYAMYYAKSPGRALWV